MATPKLPPEFEFVKPLHNSGLDEIPAEQERLMATYGNAKLFDVGHIVRVRFSGPIPPGLKAKLREIGSFRSGPDNSLQRVSSTRAIFDARAILREYLGASK